MSSLFNSEAFEQIPGQLSIEQVELEEPATWQVRVSTGKRSYSFLYVETTSPAAAAKSAQISIDAHCLVGAEIVSVELA